MNKFRREEKFEKVIDVFRIKNLVHFLKNNKKALIVKII